MAPVSVSHLLGSAFREESASIKDPASPRKAPLRLDASDSSDDNEPDAWPLLGVGASITKRHRESEEAASKAVVRRTVRSFSERMGDVYGRAYKHRDEDYEELTDRISSIIGAGFERNGFIVHADLMTQHSKAEQQKRIEEVVRLEAKTFATPSEINERLLRATQGDDKWLQPQEPEWEKPSPRGFMPLTRSALVPVLARPAAAPSAKHQKVVNSHLSGERSMPAQPSAVGAAEASDWLMRLHQESSSTVVAGGTLPEAPRAVMPQAHSPSRDPSSLQATHEGSELCTSVGSTLQSLPPPLVARPSVPPLSLGEGAAAHSPTAPGDAETHRSRLSQMGSSPRPGKGMQTFTSDMDFKLRVAAPEVVAQPSPGRTARGRSLAVDVSATATAKSVPASSQGDTDEVPPCSVRRGPGSLDRSSCPPQAFSSPPAALHDVAQPPAQPQGPPVPPPDSGAPHGHRLSGPTLLPAAARSSCMSSASNCQDGSGTDHKAGGPPVPLQATRPSISDVGGLHLSFRRKHSHGLGVDAAADAEPMAAHEGATRLEAGAEDCQGDAHSILPTCSEHNSRVTSTPTHTTSRPHVLPGHPEQHASQSSLDCLADLSALQLQLPSASGDGDGGTLPDVPPPQQQGAKGSAAGRQTSMSQALSLKAKRAHAKGVLRHGHLVSDGPTDDSLRLPLLSTKAAAAPVGRTLALKGGGSAMGSAGHGSPAARRGLAPNPTSSISGPAGQGWRGTVPAPLVEYEHEPPPPAGASNKVNSWRAGNYAPMEEMPESPPPPPAPQTMASQQPLPSASRRGVDGSPEGGSPAAPAGKNDGGGFPDTLAQVLGSVPSSPHRVGRFASVACGMPAERVPLNGPPTKLPSLRARS